MRCVVLVMLLAITFAVAAKSAEAFEGRVVWAIPDAMHLIQTADEVYIIPVTLTEDRDHVVSAQGHYRHPRPLGADARRQLRRLLGKENNWFHGLDDTLSENQRKDVGFIFRNGKDKLVLLCSLGSRLEGMFNSEQTGGSLQDKPWEKLGKWKKQYAQPELATK